MRTIHSLVANAFLGPCPPGKVITFKDSDRTNSTLSNLHYVPKQGNPGEKNGSAKLSEVQVRAILKAHQNGARGVDLARRYGVNATTISAIIKGRIWTWVPRS
ncbi:MAG: HNH endonuclease [Candidatus Korobacteraceae bacterium]